MEGAVDRLYQRLGGNYFLAYRYFYLGSAALMCAFAAAMFSLYQDMSLAEYLRTTLAAELAVGFALGWGTYLFAGHTRPIEQWLREGKPDSLVREAWDAAVVAPIVGLRQQLWRAVVFAALPASAYVAREFDLSVTTGIIIFVAILSAATYPVLLNFGAMELYCRPVVRDTAGRLPNPPEVSRLRLPLRWRLFATLPLINAVSGVFVSVFSFDGDPSFSELGTDVVVAFLVACSTSLILTVLLAQTILGPVDALLQATRRIKEGDLSARAPVVSQDELGQLTASFNAMTADLLSSRERLISAREEERRRLRRDLHDGLGPTLAASALQLDAARNLLRRDLQAADRLLETLRQQTQEAITEIRRLVYDLRPPALDELGLVGAIEERAAAFEMNGSGERSLRVTVDAPTELPALPAAVEVAAFRIAQEALTNVVRHSDAASARVHLSLNGGLVLRIDDDGRGIDPAARVGVGLASMRERAAELGGTCTIEPGSAGGTVVQATLPLPELAP